MKELLEKQHAIIEEQRQIIADLLLLLDMGGAASSKPLLTDNKKRQIRRWRDEGWTFAQIGKALNMDRSNVRNLMLKESRPDKVCSCGAKAGYSGKCAACRKKAYKSYCSCGSEKAHTAKHCMPCSAEARVKFRPKCTCGNEKDYRAEKCKQCRVKEDKAQAKGRRRHDTCPTCDKPKRKTSKNCMSCRKREGASKPMLVR